MNFKNLHTEKNPLLICNVWDVVSARAAELNGFTAIGTSSGAIATMLGYKDGEEISFDELLFIVKRIKKNTHLPLSVDIEAGYSRDPKEIINHIHQLVELGISGINIEDTTVCHQRELVDAEHFSSLIDQIAKEYGNKIFLNVRTDAFLLGLPNALEETLFRIKKYEKAGADGIFVPCIIDENKIKIVCGSTRLPVNVMCMPGLVDFEKLENLGVKRISMGNFVYNKIQTDLKDLLIKIREQKSFKTLFES